MSFKIEWVKKGSRVITQNGPGSLESFGGLGGEVRLDKEWAGSKLLYFSDTGEMSLESDFTLIRVINLGKFKPILLASAQNYPSREECMSVLEEPCASNETLLALDFQQRTFESSRKIESELPYQVLETGLSVYRRIEDVSFYSSLDEAREAWQEDVDPLAGTSGDVLLYALLDFEGRKILAKAVLTTAQVVSKETFW